MESQLEAKDIYILMSKEYRISRNVRAEWYLKRINSHIKISRKRHIRDYNEELEVISVLPVDPPPEWDYDIAHEYSYLVTEHSHLHFISRKYRLAVCLDLSPSLSSTSPDSENAFFDGIISMLQKCLRGIIKPFLIPGSQMLFYPKVYVNVIAHIPFLRSFFQQVLVQGHLLVSEKESMQFFLKEVCSKAQQLLNEIAKVTHESYNIFIEKQYAESSEDYYNNMDESFLQLAHKQRIMVNTADVAFVKMLQHSILSLQLLPENSMAGIIILTDGVLSLPNATVFETLLVHLRTMTISCSFLQLSKNYQLHSGFGYVPFCDLMSFFANATYGVYFKELPHVKKNYENEMNDYHRAFLTWGFQKRFDDGNSIPLKTGLHMDSSMIGQDACFTVRKKEWSAHVNATLNAVLSCRIREGYIIKDISVAKEQIQLILVLPWKYCISIEYHMQAPFSATHCGVQTEIWVEASYEFLNDVSIGQCNPDLRSPYRRRMVAKYWSTLQDMKKTDTILAGLQQFSSCNANYTIPDCFQKGHSVFHYNPETNMPENVSKIQFPQFETYWKRVCLLDINKWQKWMHTHKIGLILEHDSPLPKNLHITNTSARYGKIQSRQAELTLTTFLDDWTDFALIWNYSYVKILFGSEDKKPTFIVVRLITVKPPCLSVRLAFLGGTSGQLRNEVVKDFKNKVSSLVLRGRTRSKENKNPSTHDKCSDSKKESEEIDNKSIPCCILMNKPIEKILIWYDRSRGNSYFDFTSKKKFNQAYNNSLDYGDNGATNNFNLLSRYLYHRRWVWNLQPAACPAITTAAISRILNAITRLRLQEGFKFAYSKDGIVSMVKQYDLKVNFPEKIGKRKSHIEPNDLKGHCVVQYLIFPPKFNNTRVSVQEDSEESDGVEANGETQIITECWVEPQNGTIIPQNINYEQLANSFTPIDKDCIFTLATFECLVQLEKCNNNDESATSNWMASTIYNDSTQFPIEKIGFAPRVTKLINRCQQTEILFSSLTQSCCSVLLPTCEEKLRRADVANEHLYNFFAEHLEELHGTASFDLSPEENHSLPNLLQNRLNITDAQGHSPFCSATGDDVFPSCNWKCFIKYVSASHFFMTIIPATYQDLKILFLNEKNIRELNINCVKSLVTVDDLSKFDAEKADIVDTIREYSENATLSDVESLDKPRGSRPVHCASLSLISPRLNYGQDGLKGGRPVVAVGQASSQTADLPARVRYKSGPAIAASEGVAYVDSIQPASRERASSLYSNKGATKKVTVAAEVPKVSAMVPKLPQPETGGRLRKRNASMPSKGCVDLSRVRSVDALKSGLLLGADEIRTGGKMRTVERDFPEYDDLILASAVLPVYVYDSNLKVISSQLLNRTNHSSILGKDVQIDSTFKNCSVSVEKPFKSCPEANFSKLDSLDSFSEESDAIGNPAKALQCHIEAIERCHHSGFVRGVFEALTGGFYVHSLDVLSALDQCQEIVEEINLTDFLKVICGHLKDFISRTTEVKKASFSLEVKDENLEDGDKEDLFSLKLLKEHHPNRELITIQRDIKQIFNEILLKCFKPVPNLNDYYYYSPASSSFEDAHYHCKSCRNKSKKKKFSGCSNLTEEDDVISFVSRSEEVEGEDDQAFFSHSAGVFDSAKSGSKTTDEEDRCLCEVPPQEESALEVQPLFLHLTCTIRIDKHIIETRSINSLPTCLGELSDSLGVEEVDLGKVSVSLNVLALTLAGIAPLTCENNDSSFKLGQEATLVSSPGATSFGDSSILVSDNQSFVEQMGTSPAEEDQDTFIANDLLASLPCHQSNAIRTTYDKIRWFLQNEVISSKLYNCPVTEETLETVINHIENFGPITNCKIEMIPLSFIYSMEQSMDKFSEELRRVYTPGYHLEKKGCLSFLVQSSEHLRRRHLSSLVPPLICGSRAAKREDDHKDESEDQLYAKSTLSSPDCPKSPKRLAQRVSFESDSDHIIVSEGLAVVSVDIDSRFTDHQEPFGRVSPACEDDLIKQDPDETSRFDTANDINTELLTDSSGLLQPTNKPDLCVGKITTDVNIMKQLPCYDLKMRHNSGHGGVQSDLSSLLESGLITEDECEADISDSNDSNDWLQDFEPPPILLPDFWLILKSSSHFIHVYFHNRNESGLKQFMLIYLNIVNSVRGAVKLVNQRLLLQELCDTKLCSDLLEPQSSDDLWRRDSMKDSEGDGGRIAEAEMRFEMGTFSCPQAWKVSFDLHPRVKSSVAKTGIAAINSLRTCLKPFSVVNRKNMFVYEDSSGVGTNVFYLRLHEYLDQPTSSLATPEIRRDDSLTSKSPLLMHAAKRLIIDEESQSSLSDLRPRLSSFGEKDIIVEEVLSTPASRTNKDFIELCAHGVGSPGPAIKEELVQMLQKKLDDTVLDAICLMLFKNPHHKLSHEDVHFIQPPNQEPTKILRFALSPLVERHFQAVTWYLRQNMLSSGFSLPKYADSKAEFHFQDISEPETDKGAESCIYLFVCNTKEGTKSTGIACIVSSVCNVDYATTLPFSKESSTETAASLSLSDLESFLQIEEGDDSTLSERNAVLQFKIWESGRLDITELGQNIFEAIKHALWDFTMEYKILAIPPVPSHPGEEAECKVEFKGADTSKANQHAPSAVSSNLHNPIQSELQSKMFNKSPMKDRRSSEFVRSSLSSKSSAKNLNLPCASSPLGEDTDTVARELNATYTEVTIKWLEVAVSLNAPSVRKQIVKCPTKSSIPVIIAELQNWSETHLDDGNQVFHKIDESEQFVEMRFMKKQLENLITSDQQAELFILNMSSEYCTARSDLDLGELTFVLTRGKKNKRFEPSLAALSEGASTPCSPRPSLPHIVPRQICFVGVLRKKELTFYTYNWMKDLNDSLYSFFNQLTQWTSARARLLSSLALQKLGIFHNQPFTRKDCKDPCSRKEEGNKREERNAFVQSLNYVESLIKCPSPSRSVSLAADRTSHRSQNQPTLNSLLQVYRNACAPSLGACKGDPLQLHGKQMAELFRTTFLQERERRMLETMMCATETPTSLKDQWLHVLKKNSRIEHFCLTPLLFLPRWRRHIATICDQFAVDPSGDSVPTKPETRSRHGSGSSNKMYVPHTDLRRASSVGVSHRPSSPVHIRKRHVTMGDDKWYDALCLSYLKEYIQYLQSLGFVSVSIKHFNEKNKNQSTKDLFMTTPTYLMKNVIGGTLLIHINFFEPFFSTTIYAIDLSRLNTSKENPTYQIFPPTCFMDDVDLYKVLLHMHSFTFDYHLRAVCDSVADRQLLFTSGYNFFSLLTEFMRYYSKSPSYARNLVYQGDITIETTGSTDEQLYNYVLSKEKEYDMKVVRMNPIYTDHATDLNTEFALVQMKSCSFANGSETMHSDVYEVTLVICHDLSIEALNNILNLKFFIILTSKRDVYPNRGNDRSGRFRTVSTAPSRIRSSSATISGGDTLDIQAQIAEVVSLLSSEGTDSVCSEASHSKTPVRNIARQRSYDTHVGIKQESVTYLGYFSPYEEFMQNILCQQAEQSEKRIMNIFNRAKIHCRRDSLWQKLSVLEEKGKSVQSVSSLTQAELMELLRMVSVKPMSKFDPSVVPFSLKSMAWYQSFAKLVSSKYQDKCRIFLAPDGSAQYVVILNPPSFDLCLLLTINHRSQKAKLECAMKELECEFKELEFTERVCSFFEDFINFACFHLWTTIIV